MSALSVCAGVDNKHNGTSNGLRFNDSSRRHESNSNTKDQYRDTLEGANFLSKVSRFEFLSHAKGGTPNGSVKSPPPSSQSSKRTPKFPESGTTYSLQRSFNGFRSSSGSPSPGSTPSPDGAASPNSPPAYNSVRSRSPSPLRFVEKTPASTSPCNGVTPVWQTQPDKKPSTASPSYSINSLTRRSKTRQTATPLHNGYTSDDGQPSSPRAVEPPLPRSSSLKYRSSRTKPPIFPFVGIFTRDNKSLSKTSTSSQSTSALSKLKPVPGERDPQRAHRSGSPKTVTFSNDSGKALTSKRIKLPTLLKFSNDPGDVGNHVTPSLSSGVSSAKTTRGGVAILRKEKASKPPSTSDYDTVANCYSSSESLSQQQYSGYDNIDIGRNSLNSIHEDGDPAFNIYDNVAELKTLTVKENVTQLKTPVTENVPKLKTAVTVSDREYDTVPDNAAELNTLVAVSTRPDRDYDTVPDYEEILTLNSNVDVPNNGAPPVPNKPPRSSLVTLNSGADVPDYAPPPVPNKPPRSSLLTLNSCVEVPDYAPPPVPNKPLRCSLSPHSSQEDLASPWKVNLKERIKPNLQNFKGEKVFKKDTVVTNIYVPGFEPGDECVQNKQADECATSPGYTSEASVTDSKQQHRSCVPDTAKKTTNKAPQSGLLKSTNSGSTSSVVEKSKPVKSVKWSDDCIDEPAPPVSKHQQKSSFLTIGTLRKRFKKGNPVTEVAECSESDLDSEVFVEKESSTPRTMSHLRIGVKVLPGGSTVSEKSQSKSPDICNGNEVSSETNDKRGVRFSEDCDVTNVSNSDADPCQNGNWAQRLDRSSDRDSVDMTGSQRDLQQLHLRMIEERKKEQQVAAQEKQRLEDILLMCAEYEKQLESELSPPPTSKDSEKRGSMTKIKTNGSLTKLTSPSHLQKDDFSFDFKWPRNSSSSNSEQDDSEKDGTIKRRPAVTNGTLDSSSVGVATVTDDATPECATIESASNEMYRVRVNCNGFDSFQPAASPPAIPEPLRIKMPSLFASSVCDAVFSSSLGSARSGDVGCYGSDSSSVRLAGIKDRVTSSSGVETSSDQSLNGFEVRWFRYSVISRASLFVVTSVAN